CCLFNTFLFFIIWSLLFILAPTAGGAEITDLQRGLHPDFELFVLYCDTLPQVSVAYDRVQNMVTVNLTDIRLSPQASDEISRIQAGITLESLYYQSPGKLCFQVRGTVAVTTYLVSGPPAVLLDLCHREMTGGALPYELDRDAYLSQGGRAERRGELELALKYVDRVRETDGDEPALTHRAGVIQQRLGRWESALESLGKTGEIPEFAADAHARRSMIYLTMGDTLASGQEWASYFHRDRTADFAIPVKTTSFTAHRPPSNSEPNRPSYNFKPRFLPVIEAGDGNYFYLGGGLFVVGVIALISVLTGGGRGRQYESEYRDYPYDLPSPRRVRSRPLLSSPVSPPGTPYPPTSKAETSVAPPPKTPLANDTFRGISSRVVQSYVQPLPGSSRPDTAPTRSASTSTSSLPPSPADSHRILVNRIVSQARSGLSDPEIARQMGISRDEVRMILNLARLAESEPS
ncbi:MAG: hypothetical protein V2A61_04660, partial [Calditrichota bacterium]